MSGMCRKKISTYLNKYVTKKKWLFRTIYHSPLSSARNLRNIQVTYKSIQKSWTALHSSRHKRINNKTQPASKINKFAKSIWSLYKLGIGTFSEKSNIRLRRNANKYFMRRKLKQYRVKILLFLKKRQKKKVCGKMCSKCPFYNLRTRAISNLKPWSNEIYTCFMELIV